jgi:hypothetical protein
VKIKLLLFLSIISFLVTGCQSSRQMSLLPSIPTGVQPASIYLMRPHRFVGDGVATDLYLDGQLISRLASGDYTIFQVSSGLHMIGAKIGDSGFGSQRVECEAGKEYFFRAISAVTPLSTAEGERLKTNLKYVPLN